MAPNPLGAEVAAGPPKGLAGTAPDAAGAATDPKGDGVGAAAVGAGVAANALPAEPNAVDEGAAAVDGASGGLAPNGDAAALELPAVKPPPIAAPKGDAVVVVAVGTALAAAGSVGAVVATDAGGAAVCSDAGPDATLAGSSALGVGFGGAPNGDVLDSAVVDAAPAEGAANGAPNGLAPLP